MELEWENRCEGRFSKNDSHNDLVAEDIPYLMVDFMLALCHEALTIDRMNNLEIAKGLYFRFFERLIQYQIFDSERPEVKVLKRLLFEDHSECEEPQLLAWLQKPSRDLKIGRMKIILRLKTDLLTRPILSLSSSEDAYIAYWRSSLNLLALMACDNCSLLLQELQILQHGLNPEAAAKKPFVIEGKASKISKPFKLVRDRKQIAVDVFRPDYNLPTMTIDEYLDLEMRRGNIISGGGASSAPSLEKDEDDEIYLDEQLKKDRAFDEFKDSKTCVLNLNLFLHS